MLEQEGLKSMHKLHTGSAILLALLSVGSLAAYLLKEQQVAAALMTLAMGLLLPQPVKKEYHHEQDSTE